MRHDDRLPNHKKMALVLDTTSEENTVYDESSFPASAETDEEIDLQLPVAPNPGDQPCDDILCAVCTEVLVDPCTLHCGHSFCQLCLASLWKSSPKKSPVHLNCPVCRLPWTNFPGINIQLR